MRDHLTGQAFLSLFSTPLERQANTWGGEWAGPCPFCGGRDRFRVWADLGRWSCRGCQGMKQRTDVDYVLLRDHGRIIDGATATKEEKRLLAQTFDALGFGTIGSQPYERPDPEPKPCQPPSEQWQHAGNAFWEYAFCQLWDVPADQRPSHPAHQYLATRGISDDVLQWAWVGYNPTTLYRDPRKWGIDGDKQVWLPAGLVFPWMVDGVLWKLVIRPDAGENAGKYIALKDSGNPPYGVDTVEPGRPLVLVEGLLDRLVVCQATNAHLFSGDNQRIGCVATGTTWARHMTWAMRFSRASTILLAHDNEPAGDAAAAYWQDVLGAKARRHVPTRKDCGEMAQHDDDVLAWIQEGINANG